MTGLYGVAPVIDFVEIAEIVDNPVSLVAAGRKAASLDSAERAPEIQIGASARGYRKAGGGLLVDVPVSPAASTSSS